MGFQLPTSTGEFTGFQGPINISLLLAYPFPLFKGLNAIQLRCHHLGVRFWDRSSQREKKRRPIRSWWLWNNCSLGLMGRKMVRKQSFFWCEPVFLSWFCQKTMDFRKQEMIGLCFHYLFVPRKRLPSSVRPNERLHKISTRLSLWHGFSLKNKLCWESALPPYSLQSQWRIDFRSDKHSRSLLQLHLQQKTSLPRSSKGCVSWMMIRGAEKHHPLRFKQHPLEDLGICISIAQPCLDRGKSQFFLNVSFPCWILVSPDSSKLSRW